MLQLTALPGAQTPTPSPDPTWGLHLLDANVELGNLVKLVHLQSCLYGLRHPSSSPSAIRAACSGAGALDRGVSGRDSPPLRRLALVIVAALIVAFGATASVAGARTIWLCKPGDTPDPSPRVCRRRSSRGRSSRCG